jgi:predicted RNA-binding Zn-ribbon protein involved in translation (DUF1610 family)
MSNKDYIQQYYITHREKILRQQKRYERTKKRKLMYCLSCGKLLGKYAEKNKTEKCRSCSHKGIRRPDQSRRMKKNTIWQNNKFTKKTRENMRRSAIGKKLTKKTKEKIRLKVLGKNNPFYGKHHTKYFKKKMSNFRKGKTFAPEVIDKMKDGRRKGKNNPMFGKVTHGKGIYYKSSYMRSSYEITYAKWLDKQNIKWFYESKTFDLGNTTYTPDFYLPESDTYIEIKGWWRDDAKKKFKLFKKLFPKIKIEVLIKKDLEKIGVLV